MECSLWVNCWEQRWNNGKPCLWKAHSQCQSTNTGKQDKCFFWVCTHRMLRNHREGGLNQDWKRESFPWVTMWGLSLSEWVNEPSMCRQKEQNVQRHNSLRSLNTKSCQVRIIHGVWSKAGKMDGLRDIYNIHSTNIHWVPNYVPGAVLDTGKLIGMTALMKLTYTLLPDHENSEKPVRNPL